MKQGMTIRAGKLFDVRLMLLLCCAMVSTASAATIVVENLATDFRGQSPVVHATQTVHLDMSGFADLTRDEPISLTLSATAPLLWLGIFTLGPSGVSIQHDATLRLTAGDHSIFAFYSWRSPETGFLDPGPQPPNTSNIAGFMQGPLPDDLTLVVPWGTDLSDVQVTLVEDSLLTGAGSTYSQSSIAFTAETITGSVGAAPLLRVQSVPEPNAFGFLAIGIAVALGLGSRRSSDQAPSGSRMANVTARSERMAASLPSPDPRAAL